MTRNESSAALRLAQQYQSLAYFSHGLEILLHHVLDEEVDSAPAPEAATLPRVLSLLSSFPDYLDVVVQCTRKTEARSWRTLFAYLPPAQELFEESLLRGNLKTAGGYLLVLHTFDEVASASEQSVRLLARAMREGDWELCKELARFLAALDDSGDTLRGALEMVNVSPGGGVVVAGDLARKSPGTGGGDQDSDGQPVPRLLVPPAVSNGTMGGSNSSSNSSRDRSRSRESTSRSIRGLGISDGSTLPY